MSDKALIIGDAAHAMVPFFAQGMNSVGIFFVLLHYSNTLGGGTPTWLEKLLMETTCET